MTAKHPPTRTPSSAGCAGERCCIDRTDRASHSLLIPDLRSAATRPMHAIAKTTSLLTMCTFITIRLHSVHLWFLIETAGSTGQHEWQAALMRNHCASADRGAGRGVTFDSAVRVGGGLHVLNAGLLRCWVRQKQPMSSAVFALRVGHQ